MEWLFFALLTFFVFLFFGHAKVSSDERMEMTNALNRIADALEESNKTQRK